MTAAAGHECVGIIPARLGSTRFPGKVLADRTGKPLIQHVWESARRASRLARVVIAADDDRVLEAARGFGAEAVKTRVDHANGTSRLSEAAAALGLGERAIVVNVQGDEPELEPAAIDAAVIALETLEPSGAVVGTVATRIEGWAAVDDPAVVKVVRDARGLALYFSRAAIPMARDGREAAAANGRAWLRHVGIYAYRRGFLDRYVALSPTALEMTEQLEQLRVLEHGFGIAVGLCETAHAGIDTPEQYEAFVERWRSR